MFDGNKAVMDFVSLNWLPMLVVWGLAKAFFPNWKLLDRIGERFAVIFPQFKKKDSQ